MTKSFALKITPLKLTVIGALFHLLTTDSTVLTHDRLYPYAVFFWSVVGFLLNRYAGIVLGGANKAHLLTSGPRILLGFLSSMAAGLTYVGIAANPTEKFWIVSFIFLQCFVAVWVRRLKNATTASIAGL
jgi:hypothetical protein